MITSLTSIIVLSPLLFTRLGSVVVVFFLALPLLLTIISTRTLTSSTVRALDNNDREVSARCTIKDCDDMLGDSRREEAKGDIKNARGAHKRLTNGDGDGDGDGYVEEGSDDIPLGSRRVMEVAIEEAGNKKGHNGGIDEGGMYLLVLL
ncbi:hypothetical protein B296_00040092 [Ensete ventricosum]|uniref:Uncharacterized protein n=1 Tax=Ensete ventricosum TaxID=4639 RepID=A0A426ZDY5_ENSVE|nr:hypothetical protein B296_00040092 [Ensete ventricosum]